MELDDLRAPEIIDHVGWRLWRLARQWKVEFDREMLARGYPWVDQARGAVIGLIQPGGLSQSSLAPRLGISKQAVQQFVDALVREGAVERLPDPADKRGRIVRLTRRGIAFVTEGNDVKRGIEARYAARIGQARFDALNAALDELAAAL